MLPQLLILSAIVGVIYMFRKGEDEKQKVSGAHCFFEDIADDVCGRMEKAGYKVDCALREGVLKTLLCTLHTDCIDSRITQIRAQLKRVDDKKYHRILQVLLKHPDGRIFKHDITRIYPWTALPESLQKLFIARQTDQCLSMVLHPRAQSESDPAQT